MNWAGWHIPSILALNGVSNRHTLIIKVGGIGSTIDGVVLLVLNLPLGIMNRVNLHAIHYLRLIWN